jgi:hypothetical protein
VINIETFKSETLPLRALVIISLLTGLAVLFYVTGGVGPMLASLTMLITEGGLLVLLTLACAAWGDLLISTLLPKDTPPMLRFATSAAIGLWLWGTAMLLVGSLTTGLLTAWAWWPVIGIGFVVGAIRHRRSLDSLRFPEEVRAHWLLWTLIAAAGAIWLSGALRPPGLLPAIGGASDAIRYLQLPREFLAAGQVSTLDHNIYSHFPMNTEMLYLTMMCLRGGAYPGLYAAKLVHGLFIILAGLALIGALPTRKPRGYTAAMLVVTAPLALFLSWHARAELPCLLYMALAMVWMGRWLTLRRWQAAGMVGLAMGAACASAYWALPMILLPTLAVMALATLRKPATLSHVAMAALLAVALMSPWLIRNMVTTGNPIFPVASQSLGGPAGWSDECQQRWIASHGRQALPPVPTPENWQASETPSALERLYRDVLFNEYFGPMTLALAGLALCFLFARRQRDPWDTALVGIVVFQLAAWLAMGANASPLTVLPILIPLALLVGGMIEWIWPIEGNPFRPKQHIPDSPWGPMAAKVLVTLTVVVNLLIGIQASKQMLDRSDARVAMPAEAVVEFHSGPFQLGEDARLMVIGDPWLFYFPVDTIAATEYNTHPLAAMVDEGLSPEAILARLQADGITHIWVNWDAIYVQAHSAGYPAALSEPMASACSYDYATGLTGERNIAILNAMIALEPGLTEVPYVEPEVPGDEEAADTEAADDAPAEEAESDEPYRPVTIYALPAALAAESLDIPDQTPHDEDEITE